MEKLEDVNAALDLLIPKERHNNLTYDDARDVLNLLTENNKYILSEDAIRSLVNKVSMDSTNEDVINTPNNVTMLYSGNYQEIPTKRFISENVRHLASVGWVLAPTRLDMTNNIPIFQAA